MDSGCERFGGQRMDKTPLRSGRTCLCVTFTQVNLIYPSSLEVYPHCALPSAQKVSAVTEQEMAITFSLAAYETQQSKTNMQKERPLPCPGDLKGVCSHAVMRASRMVPSEHRMGEW